jgi:hypothetical protein
VVVVVIVVVVVVVVVWSLSTCCLVTCWPAVVFLFSAGSSGSDLEGGGADGDHWGSGSLFPAPFPPLHAGSFSGVLFLPLGSSVSAFPGTKASPG